MYIYAQMLENSVNVVVSVYESSNETVIVNNQAMTALGNGCFKYYFSSRDLAKEYYFIANDTANSVYAIGSLEAITTSTHEALDTYSNKDEWKADVSNLSNDVNIVSVQGTTVTSVEDFKAVVEDIDLTPVINAITSLNNLSLLDIEGSTVLAKQATLSVIVSNIAQIPTTDSVADLSPVLTAISNLNDVSPSEVRAAFNAADFKDKNTEAEVHAWLDSYSNKASYGTSAQDIADTVWNKVI